MEHRTFIRTGLAAIFFVSLISACKTSEEPAIRPNILLILADDLGYGEVGSYGQTKIETPNIDRLSTEGIRFTQHYSGSAVCAPSRCVLMTGLHTGHAYIRGNDEWTERGDVWDYAKAVDDPALEGQRPIPAGTQTVARLLQQAGYRTACVGKWGLGGPLTEGAPNNQGFDLFFGYNCQRQAHTYFPRHLWKNSEKVWLENELVVPGTKLDEGADPKANESYSRYSLGQYAPDLMIEEALSFMEESRGKPFFLYFSTPIPHAPLQVSAEWVNHYVEKLGDEEPYLADQGYFPNRYPHAAYAGMVSYLDAQVGQMIDKLDELGIAENTLILFTSDNGPTYAGGADSPYFDSAGPFKSEQGWGKGSLREGGIRVPMIARWAGKIAPSSESDHISAFYDILPTLCQVAGLPVPDGLDGVSFLPELLGSEDQAAHKYMYWEFPAAKGQQALRMGDWKGLRKNIFDGDLQIELYNLKLDPQEQNNVASDHPEIVKQIEEFMKQAHRPANVKTFRFPQLGDQPED